VGTRTAPEAEAFSRPPGTEPQRLPPLSPAGTAVALLFGCASFTPSLLPRAWWLQAVVVGLSAAFGYWVGVFVGWLVVTVSGRSPSPATRRRLWMALAAIGVPLLSVTLWLGHRWQEDLHRLMGAEPPDSYAWVRILLVALAWYSLLVGVGLVLVWLVRTVAARLARRLPRRLARPLAVVLVGVLLVGFNNGLVWRVLVEAANVTSSVVNGATKPGDSRPSAPERSGSPASLTDWRSLGRQGRDFVAGGPSQAQLRAFSGKAPGQPVRVYVGLDLSQTTRQRAALAVRELQRAGGFDRSVLVVVTTTGTGLVEPDNADAIEYLHNGDSAIVSMQYSYLPSWISFLVDQEKALQAGRELFNQVYDAWLERPAASRPRLLVSGTSLGAFGAEGAFSGLEDLRHRTDGVVLAGPPNASVLHGELVAQRDPGTPEWLPVVDGGHPVRFAAAASDLRVAPGSSRPELVYLQHGSDPIVYWSPRLLFDRPDWLGEPAATDVSPDMFWMPVVTFWQVTADLPFALNAPPGHGHHYREIFADAWAAVAPPPGWGEEDTQRLRARLATPGE